MSEHQQIHPSIVKAICAVKTTMSAVKKSQINKHGGYRFASTDDIYAALTHKMGEVGLICLTLEDGKPEIERVQKDDGKTAVWLKVSFRFILATEDYTWFDPDARRTLFIQITGPQTFQAAQSYAEKSYLRSVFKIPTGDLDLDSLPEGFEYSSIMTKKQDQSPPSPEDVSQDREDYLDPQGIINGIKSQLACAQDIEDLSEIWSETEHLCDQLTVDQKQELIVEYHTIEDRLNGKDKRQMDIEDEEWQVPPKGR